MNINPAAMGNVYKKVSNLGQVNQKGFSAYESALRAATTSSAPGTEKMDTISLSPAAAQQKEVAHFSKAVMRDIQRMDRPARVEAIARAVEDGSYHAATEAVADAILGQSL